MISDTGNNRLVIVSADTNECLDVIGNGYIGLIDGSFDDASFHHPQGLCHVFREGQHFLYVCDTKNHAIREINLSTKEVLTVIGTGEKGRDKEGNKDPEIQKLSSPWDIVPINRDTLIIAMAGTHQIWALNLKNVSKLTTEQMFQLQWHRWRSQHQFDGRPQEVSVGAAIRSHTWSHQPRQD